MSVPSIYTSSLSCIICEDNKEYVGLGLFWEFKKKKKHKTFFKIILVHQRPAHELMTFYKVGQLI